VTLRALLSTVVAQLRADGRLARAVVTRPHPLIVLVQSDERVVVLAPAAVWERGREVLRPFLVKLAAGEASWIMLGRSKVELSLAQSLGLSAVLAAEPSADELFIAISSALRLVETSARSGSRDAWLSRYRYELSELIEIAKAVTTERDVDKLLGLILEKSRLITGADAGSLYVVEGDEPEISARRLRFKVTQNDSVSFASSEFTVPISPRSMSGYVALTRSTLNIADVYDLPANAPYAFDRSFDESIHYHTRSMLCVPLLSRAGDVIGVLQLINKKHKRDSKLLGQQDLVHQVGPFDARSEELVGMLAAQAGVALENAILHEEIQRMLQGFVRASVEAIEQRDPTTSGHSRRVAELTVGLAKAIERQDAGPYREVVWTPDDLRELEYASLLHDFGKIGVREEVLVKAKKLYPHELVHVQQRFELALRSAEVDVLSRKLGLVERGASADELALLDQQLARRRIELGRALSAIMAANEPTVLSGGDFQIVEAIARDSFTDAAGRELLLLSPSELASLSIPRGSLTSAEIDEIRSHVLHTFQFLAKIPWGKQFRRVAMIAGSHHERVNGTGYPARLRAEEIPLQSRMMSVSDIFDALTASDRPYKKAVPLEKALDILSAEVRDQHLDPELVRIFIDARLWERP
jgi:HD-GYP domain-containing protein (c-di-GMP phosphodiesterase class II)